MRKELLLCQSDLWTLFGCGIKGAADYPPLGSLHAPPDKLVIYGLLHVDPRTCCAALAGVEEHTLVGLFHSHIHWDEGEFSYTSPTNLKRCFNLEGEEIVSYKTSPQPHTPFTGTIQYESDTRHPR